MPKKRAYGAFCGLAHALDLVGERWSLLIVRDLLVSPGRFTDLLRGLPNIPTNILSARLKELEAAGIVARRLLPLPERSIVYELTVDGAALHEAVMALDRWGTERMGDVAPGEPATIDALLRAMRSSFRPSAASGPPVAYEIHYEDMVAHAQIQDGQLAVGAGPLAKADLVIEGGPALPLLLSGKLTPAEAISSGRVKIFGDSALLARFAEMFIVHMAH